MSIDHLFRYCPHCASPDFKSVAETAFACGACGFYYHHNIATAVGALLRDERGRLLFLRRAKDPHAGKLGIPGGFVSPGETDEETVRREVREELGLELGELEYVGGFPNVYPYRGVDYQVLDLYFRGCVPNLAGVVLSDEVAGYELHDPAAVDPAEIAFASLRTALTRL